MHALFGTKHLILIVLSFLAAALLFLLTRKWKFSTVCKNMFYLGIVSEFIKVVYYITANEEAYGGVLPKSDLPFHLCSIQILFFAVINFTSNEKIKRVLYSFMLPSCLFGGIAAILIATDSSRNGLWILTLQYFAYHTALIVFSL
ncbi:MAG: YwaF family protein, partial [Firmicutes bacterium]|nr:YwaF family protein [Bacillota bacterium]